MRSTLRLAFGVWVVVLANSLSGMGLAQPDGPSIGGDSIAELKAWISRPVEQRGDLLAAEWAEAPLSKAEAREATELLLADRIERLKAEREQEWSDKLIRLNDLEMKFEFRVFGEKPENGRSLFLSMHGGGGAPSRVNEQQWKNQIGLYEPEEGVYLAPRAPTDTWNLWHQSHIDLFFARIIEDAILFEGVDPNRVYLMGYSAGGDGVYQLAPRMADQLAAAAMMAGHPNDASPLGLRNIGFTLHMGGKDSAYNRNEIAAQWKERLAELQQKDPGGYKHEVVIHPEHGHWMNRDDQVAVPWMARFTRDPLPTKIVWRQAGTTHSRFYWLAVDEDNRKGGSEVVATRQGQAFVIEKADGIQELRVRLNDQLCDLDQPIQITTPDGKQSTVTVQRNMKHVVTSLNERLDPDAIYSAEISVPLPVDSEPTSGD